MGSTPIGIFLFLFLSFSFLFFFFPFFSFSFLSFLSFLFLSFLRVKGQGCPAGGQRHGVHRKDTGVKGQGCPAGGQEHGVHRKDKGVRQMDRSTLGRISRGATKVSIRWTRVSPANVWPSCTTSGPGFPDFNMCGARERST